jgi:hypothetical protein
MQRAWNERLSQQTNSLPFARLKSGESPDFVSDADHDTMNSGFERERAAF